MQLKIDSPFSAFGILFILPHGFDVMFENVESPLHFHLRRCFKVIKVAPKRFDLRFKLKLVMQHERTVLNVQTSYNVFSKF